MLTADLLTDTWTVIDTEGGRWFPSAEAAEEIEAAADPAATAVAICDATPTRGTWRD